MTRDAIALIGGGGTVGRWAARFLRQAHPTVPLLIGGRDPARTKQAVAGLDFATPIVLDLAAEDLGFGAHRVSAVATLFTDDTGAILHWAQQRGAGHVSISPGLTKLGPEVAGFVHAPAASPVVLGTEWLVGATSVPTLLFSRAFGRLNAIHIGALLDEEDDFGPAARADLDRQVKSGTTALVRCDGAWRWLAGEEVTSRIRAIDGTVLPASAFTPNDVLALATVTGASNIRFDLALGTSSTRRAGGQMSTEILIDLVGEDHAGRPLRTRHAIVHPEGQMPLTGLGVALVLERLSGLVGDPVGAGLYFPSQLIDHATYLERLTNAGGNFSTLNP